MIYTDQERNEFTSFQKNRSQFIERFMKKVVPNFNKPPGAKRALMIQEPVGPPQSEKVHSMKESTPSQHVQKSPILPPANSTILPLLSPESTISILSPLPATPKLASSETKDLERHKSRKYVSSSSSDDSSSNSDEEDPTKTQQPSSGIDVAPAPYKVKEVPAPTYKPSATVLDAFFKCLLKQQEERIILNIGGRKFETSQSTLLSQDSLLSKLIQKDPPKDDSKVYFIDRNPRYFDFVLDFLRGRTFDPRVLPVDKVALRQIQVEAEFYKLRGLTQAVEKRIPKVPLPKNLWEEWLCYKLIITCHVIEHSIFLSLHV